MRLMMNVEMFGVPLTMETIVREVSKSSIPADVFAVPDHYRQVDDPIEVFQLLKPDPAAIDGRGDIPRMRL